MSAHTYPLGTVAPSSRWRPHPDVIGDVLRTGTGNTALRIGRTLPETGWEQVGYVVLTPAERAQLIETLQAHDVGTDDSR